MSDPTIIVHVDAPTSASPADVITALAETIMAIARATGIDPVLVFRAMTKAAEAAEAKRAAPEAPAKPTEPADASPVRVPPVSFATRGGVS